MVALTMQFKYAEPADSNLFPDEGIKKQIELDFLLKFDTLSLIGELFHCSPRRSTRTRVGTPYKDCAVNDQRFVEIPL